jgi:hypothetical protein
MPGGLRPWAYGPFDLLVHADLHRLGPDDFDRRIAMISYDNAIEVAITIFLTLNPIQRQNRIYTKDDVEKALVNYHTKIEFFFLEIQRRSCAVVCDQAEIVWYHGVRNNQYHGEAAAVPLERDLDGIRKAAVWIFSILFDVLDAEDLIAARVRQLTNKDLPEKTEKYDKLIDDKFGMCEVAEELHYTSEALYAIDPIAYSEAGSELATMRQNASTQEKSDGE